MKIKDNNFDGILDILIKTPFSMNTDKTLHFKHKLACNLFCNYSKHILLSKLGVGISYLLKNEQSIMTYNDFMYRTSGIIMNYDNVSNQLSITFI